MDKYNHILDLIEKLPRVKLANIPTPLEEAPHLSRFLNNARILFKRDDLTGLPLSGNKTRMFEFSLVKALEEKADIVLAGASTQSNYCRQLAYAANKLGLETRLVLFTIRGNKDYEIQGNLFLDLLAGARVKIIKSDLSKLRDSLKKAKEEIEKEEGKKVFLMRSSDYYVALEGIAYTNCGLELYRQLKELNIKNCYVFLCSSDTTQAGLIVANKYLEAGWKIVGASPMVVEEGNAKERIFKIASNISEILKLGINIDEEDVVNTSKHVGPRYGLMTEEGKKAIEVVARTESIILDPVYSSKGMACLFDYANQGKLNNKDVAVFIHTGGFPSIFAYSDEFNFENLNITI